MKFNLLTMKLIFLLNYLTGSRVHEITSLTTKSVDFDLNVLKFKVKDTLRRQFTTKVLPIHPYLRQELITFLDMRASVLAEINQQNFKYLFIREKEGILRPIKDSEVNEFYKDMSAEIEIPYFTSHPIRYQSQSDMTGEGLEFTFTNCVLSHYPGLDEIFNPDSEISFEVFSKEYIAVIDKMLEFCHE